MHDAVVMSKVILLGSPTINKTMVKPMWDLFSVIDPMANVGKIGGVFGSYGWSGEGITMAETLIKSMALAEVSYGIFEILGAVSFHIWNAQCSVTDVGGPMADHILV